MKQNKGFIKEIIMAIIAILILLIISAIVEDFKYFSKLYDAKTPEEIKIVCNSNWYQNSTIENLPAKCSTILKN